MAELVAAREALTLALDASFIRGIVLEGSNIFVMNAIRSKEDGLSFGGALVADIGKIGLSCNKLMFSSVRR